MVDRAAEGCQEGAHQLRQRLAVGGALPSRRIALQALHDRGHLIKHKGDINPELISFYKLQMTFACKNDSRNSWCRNDESAPK